MARAAQMLKETTLPIGTISAMVSYADQLHFSPGVEFGVQARRPALPPDPFYCQGKRKKKTPPGSDTANPGGTNHGFCRVFSCMGQTYPGPAGFGRGRRPGTVKKAPCCTTAAPTASAFCWCTPASCGCTFCPTKAGVRPLLPPVSPGSLPDVSLLHFAGGTDVM